MKQIKCEQWAAWLDKATEKICLGMERDEVREEPRDHLEDNTWSLLQSHPTWTEEEAQQMALGQMGQAEPLRDRLAKIYDPLGGYLWLASQCLLYAAAVGFGVCLILGIATVWQIANLF